MTSSDPFSNPAPVVTSLEEVYDSNVLESQRIRFKHILEQFKSKYGREPEFFARSPGRVNLIGEHIDYSGYSVLPMAIDRDMVIAVGIKKSDSSENAKITLDNTNEKYPRREFEHDHETYVTIDPTVHEWSNYFKCGYKGVFEELGLKQAVSFDALASGIVPAGAGVSSSSAFVCCSALATLTANGLTMSKSKLTGTAIRSEKYAGVQIGGMDQSISVMGMKGSALLIHFYPELKANPISFPSLLDPPVFVIANTLVTADKHVTAPTNYNLRVVETRIGAALLCKKLGLTSPESGLLTFRQLEDMQLGERSSEGQEAPRLMTMIELVEKHLHKEPYTREEAAQELGMTVAELESKFVGSIVIRAENFQIYQRAKHVFGEAKRVFEFRDACQKQWTNLDEVLPTLGELMNASHAGCRDLFNCSCPELDELTTICRKAGAYGSRLTGAGWGGCSVSLVNESKVESFIQTVTEQYYFKKWPAWKSDPEALKKLKDYIFASKPGIGATIIKTTSF